MAKIGKSALEMTARRRRAKNFGPNLMTREGVGGYAATQKKLGRCFRFEKKIVPYGIGSGSETGTGLVVMVVRIR